MAQVIWTPKARKDLERLYDFLADKNRVAAHRCVESIEQACYMLSDMPRMGQLMPGDSARREWFIDFGSAAYVLRYRLDGKDNIIIIRVWHSREYKN